MSQKKEEGQKKEEQPQGWWRLPLFPSSGSAIPLTEYERKGWERVESNKIKVKKGQS